jgi:CheY-like chemotaxis protein
LIVADEPLLRQALADLFADEGDKVRVAADGQEALERLTND